MHTRVRIIHLLSAFFLAISFSACEKDVTLDLANQEGKYIIVDANITDDGFRQWIRLSLSTSYYSVSNGEGVTGARVSIRTDSLEFIFNESQIDSLQGYYYNDVIPKHLENQSVTLTIEHQEKIITAESLWKPLPLIDSLTLRINPFSELGFTPDTIYDLLVHFEELTSPDDYYLFNLYVNDTLRTVRPGEKGLVEDENLEEYVSLPVLNINRADLKPGDKVMLEMRSISRENFEFYNVFFFQTDLSGNPFAGAPPANIPTNLSEGARGFFQVSSVKRKSIIFQPSLE
jgi:hypothetical protein